MKKLNDIFLSIADSVSYAMGTPANIMFWIIAVSVWIGLFALNVLGPNTSILPTWFTSNAFNFPLNTVTTLAELYIGFLVGAAANRNERHNQQMIKKQDEMLELLLKQQTEELSLLHDRTITIINSQEALEKTFIRIMEKEVLHGPSN